jgi:hypothetical protein
VLGKRGAGAEQVREEEDKMLGLVPYKEPVNFFSQFFQHFSLHQILYNTLL